MKAKVFWIKPEDGGKKTIPSINIVFYPMIKDNQSNKLVPWSVSLINIEFISEYTSCAEINFLFKDAPQNIITSGAELELFEGTRFVAKAKIE